MQQQESDLRDSAFSEYYKRIINRICTAVQGIKYILSKSRFYEDGHSHSKFQNTYAKQALNVPGGPAYNVPDEAAYNVQEGAAHYVPDGASYNVPNTAPCNVPDGAAYNVPDAK